MALQDYINQSLRALHTGSRVVYDPPVMNTDDDYLLLIEAEHQWRIIRDLQQEGFIRGGSLETTNLYPLMADPNYEHRNMGEVFKSFKKEYFDRDGQPPYVLNIMLTADENYFDNFYYATVVAKRLNLRNKPDRVALFQGVCFDEWDGYEGVLLK